MPTALHLVFLLSPAALYLMGFHEIAFVLGLLQLAFMAMPSKYKPSKPDYCDESIPFSESINRRIDKNKASQKANRERILRFMMASPWYQWLSKSNLEIPVLVISTIAKAIAFTLAMVVSISLLMFHMTEGDIQVFPSNSSVILLFITLTAILSITRYTRRIGSFTNQYAFLGHVSAIVMVQCSPFITQASISMDIDTGLLRLLALVGYLLLCGLLQVVIKSELRSNRDGHLRRFSDMVKIKEFKGFPQMMILMVFTHIFLFSLLANGSISTFHLDLMTAGMLTIFVPLVILHYAYIETVAVRDNYVEEIEPTYSDGLILSTGILGVCISYITACLSVGIFFTMSLGNGYSTQEFIEEEFPIVGSINSRYTLNNDLTITRTPIHQITGIYELESSSDRASLASLLDVAAAKNSDGHFKGGELASLMVSIFRISNEMRKETPNHELIDLMLKSSAEMIRLANINELPTKVLTQDDINWVLEALPLMELAKLEKLRQHVEKPAGGLVSLTSTEDILKSDYYRHEFFLTTAMDALGGLVDEDNEHPINQIALDELDSDLLLSLYKSNVEKVMESIDSSVTCPLYFPVNCLP